MLFAMASQCFLLCVYKYAYTWGRGSNPSSSNTGPVSNTATILCMYMVCMKTVNALSSSTNSTSALGIHIS